MPKWTPAASIAKEGQDHLGGRIGIEGDAGVPGAEPAGAAGRHRVGRRIEPGHACQFQRKERHQRQGDVSQEHPVGEAGAAVPGEGLAGHGGDFRPGQGRFVRARSDHREQRDDAHAAHPGRRDAPELQAARERFDVVQDGRPGRREARNALEEGVDGRELAAVEQERKHPEQAGHQPGPDDDAVPFLERQLMPASPDEENRVAADDGRQEGGEQQRNPALVARSQACDDARHGHQGRDEEQGNADIPCDYLPIHCLSDSGDKVMARDCIYQYNYFYLCIDKINHAER